MKKVKIRKAKKRHHSLLLVGVIVFGISVLSNSNMVFAQNKISGIKVLKNQQKEINEVLSIKNIVQLQNIADIFWMDENQLLCVENVNGVENLIVYNADTKKTTRITNNKEKYNARYFIAGSDKKMSYNDNKYMVYTEKQTVTNKRFLYSLNTEDFTVKKIDEGMYGLSRVSNDRVAYIKGKKIILFNLCTGERKDIKLPNDLYNKLTSPAWTFEEFLAIRAKERFFPPKDEESKAWLKVHYDSITSEFVEKVDLKDDKLYIQDSYLEGYNYVLDLKTNTYINATDSNDFDGYDPKRVEVGLMTLKGVKLWELNEKGERVKIIDEGMIDSITVSSDGSKLIYEVQQNGIGTTYIYDFNTGEKVGLYLETNSRVFWNGNSNRLAYKNYIFEGDKCVSEVVNVITIN
ncbi:hypothetical protein PV797_12615 [Clostridiaceae bacterium M8S5]|nr:hypothetical protein PV797_12615 [Clostridiaceae bacterium M8S5]